jgi:tRNA/tmRNA/rRNA uracil-C5-methylase (TrmA/RlmC/RlmD family)
VRDLLTGFAELFTSTKSRLDINLGSTEAPSEVTNLPSTLLWGEDAIEEELLGLRFRLRPNAFLQTNTEMAERLYELAQEYAGLTGEARRAHIGGEVLATVF